SSGGFAGMGNRPVSTVNTDNLPADIKDRACAAFDPGNLDKIAAQSKAPGKGMSKQADRFTYRIMVKEASGSMQSFEMAEEDIPAEMIDLIDEMDALQSK